MKASIVFTLLAILSLPACKVAEIQLDSTFKNQSIEMPVKGKNKFKAKRTVLFGEYVLAENRNAWSRTSRWNTSPKWKRGKQDIHFDIASDKGQVNEFYGKSTLERLSFEIFEGIVGDLLELDLFVDDVFIGNIQSSSTLWDFMVFDINRTTNKRAKGLLISKGVVFHIDEVRRLEGINPIIETDRYGYEIRSGEEVVVTVRLFGNGKIWIKNSLDVATQHLLATAAAALLLHNPTDS